MVLMTAVAVGAAWLPKVWEPVKLICFGTVPIAGMCLPSHFFRGVDGFRRGVVLCGIFCYCGSMMFATKGAQVAGSWLGRDWGIPLGILAGGFLGGVVTGFLAGVVGAFVARLLEDLT